MNKNERSLVPDPLASRPCHTTPGEKEESENSQAPKPEYTKALMRWHALCRRYPLLWRLVAPTLNECQPPPAMNHDGFRSLVGTIRDPRYAPILLELLMELLGPELVKLIVLLQERRKA